MKKYFALLSSAAVLMFLSFTGFECASTEMTSAKLYIQQKNYDKAIEALQKEISKNPKSDEAYYTLGLLYADREDAENMVVNYTKALEISNKYEKDIRASRKSFWGGSFNKAVAFFNKAQAAKNKDTSNMYFEKSAGYFNAGIKAEPDSADTYKNLAYVYFNLGKVDDAIAPLTKLVSLKKTADGFRSLGQLYYTKGADAKTAYDKSKVAADSITSLNNFNKAVEVLEEGKKFNPNDQDILVLLSNSYIAANKAEIAMGTFKEGVEKDPKNKYFRYNLAVLLLGKNEYEAAEEQFKAALELDPEYLNADYNLAVTYVKWGVTLQKKADDAGKDDPEIKAKYRKALPYLETYVLNKKDDAPTYELLGKVYSVLGMQNEAKTAFENADKIRNK